MALFKVKGIVFATDQFLLGPLSSHHIYNAMLHTSHLVLENLPVNPHYMLGEKNNTNKFVNLKNAPRVSKVEVGGLRRFQ